jgi:hypothetical protein
VRMLVIGHSPFARVRLTFGDATDRIVDRLFDVDAWK